MTFRPPLPLLERVLRFKAIKFKEGKLFVWGMPAILNATYVTIYFWRLLENQFGIKNTIKVLYNVGKFQAIHGVKIINERFGYAKTITNKKNLLDFNVGNTALVGAGLFKVKIADFKEDVFVINGKSSFAEEYKRFFGAQKTAIDHFIRGGFAGILEAILNKKMFCAESLCMVKNNSYCKFVIKPLKKWNKQNPLVKEQLVTDNINIKKLNAKIEPYLVFH